MKLFKVSVSLCEDGWHQYVTEFMVTETDNEYMVDQTIIPKDKILMVDTIFRESHKSLQYYTYCLEHQKKVAVNMLKNHIVNKISVFKHEIEQLLKHISYD